MVTPRLDARPGRGRLLWLVGIAAVLMVGIIAAGLFWRHEAGAATDAAIGWLREAGPLAFFGAMAVLPAVGFPLMPFTLAAGPVFGPTLGPGWVIACAILAVAINVTLTYWLAARALHPLAVRLVGRWGYRLPQAGTDSAWQIAAVVRLAPGPPFWLQSYVLGIARVAFVPYLVVSIVVPAGYIAGVILGGDALYRGRANAAWFGLGLVVLTAVAIQLWRRHRAGRAAAAREARGTAADRAVPPA